MKRVPGRNGGTLNHLEKGDVIATGKPKGTKNRATILKQFLGLKILVKNPSTGEEEKRTFEEIIELAILKKAGSGDINAYKEIKDTLYGKLTEKTEHSGGIKTDITSIKIIRTNGGAPGS
jgi:hypothetical protein